MTPADHDNGAPKRDDGLLAAEYVIGVLSARERAAVERRMRLDKAFAALVESWELHFSPLADAYEEVPPPPAVNGPSAARLIGLKASPNEVKLL